MPTAILVLIALLSSFAIGQGHHDHARHSHDGSDPYGVFLDHTSPAICTVSFILEVQGGAMDQELPITATGTFVSADGLIMLSAENMDLGNRMNRMRRGRGGRGGGGNGMEMDFETSVADLRVMIAGDFEEHEAEMVARDSKMGLAFIRLVDMAPLETLEFVAFTSTRTMVVGEELFGINRLGEAHDHEAYLGWTRLAGRTPEPRQRWVVTPGFSARGLPLFNRFGEAVGILTTPMATSDDRPRGGRGGGQGGLAGGNRAMLVPASEVQTVIERARQEAAGARTVADPPATPTATEED